MQDDMTSKRGVQVDEVPSGAEEISLIKDPAPERSYDLVIVSKIDRAEIPLQTPEAQGWMLRHAVLIKAATSATLVPRVSGMPEVTVNLGEDKQLIYFRRVQGKISNRYVTEKVVHVLGWSKRDISFAAFIHPDGSITLGE